MEQSDSHILGVLRAGLDRFYDEGHYVWSKLQIAKVLGGIDVVNTPSVQGVLSQWEQEGFIKLIGNDQSYLRVLRPFT